MQTCLNSSRNTFLRHSTRLFHGSAGNKKHLENNSLLPFGNRFQLFIRARLYSLLPAGKFYAPSLSLSLSFYDRCSLCFLPLTHTHSLSLPVFPSRRYETPGHTKGPVNYLHAFAGKTRTTSSKKSARNWNSNAVVYISCDRMARNRRIRLLPYYSQAPPRG